MHRSITICFSEKPKLFLDGIIGRKIKVRAGEPININIPLSGAPAPKCEWMKNKINIPESNRVYVSKNLFNIRTVLIIFNPNRLKQQVKIQD